MNSTNVCKCHLVVYTVQTLHFCINQHGTEKVYPSHDGGLYLSNTLLETCLLYMGKKSIRLRYLVKTEF